MSDITASQEKTIARAQAVHALSPGVGGGPEKQIMLCERQFHLLCL